MSEPFISPVDPNVLQQMLENQHQLYTTRVENLLAQSSRANVTALPKLNT